MLLAAIFSVAVVFLAWADEREKTEEPTHEYVGVKKCRICHKKDSVYESWQSTPHATAWDSLSVDDQKNEELLPYYTTGTSAKGDLLKGIQCEACHGPGSDYSKKSIMEDREKAIAKGLLIPTEETCKKCHNESAPPALAATVTDWDYEKMKAKGVHVLKAEEEVSE